MDQAPASSAYEGTHTPSYGCDHTDVDAVTGVCPLLRESNAHPEHPGFLAYIPSAGTFTGSPGAALATGFAVPTGWRPTGPAASAIESATIGWLVDRWVSPQERRVCSCPVWLRRWNGFWLNFWALSLFRWQVGSYQA
ncbi:hypothetical protein OG413_38280 [Streptomyces sp. NBC_01433]|uniref:hypothetical protein n=1 Tax=Streptomyces sp. NBC_01433 TaxID=2903864 RepID=UPI00224E6CD4|nr:hypothetical protein [Streptomyces sp. NBC_01433]MCX4681059.1 hypothetical protein [Streptomyces sp. NBC_01433]